MLRALSAAPLLVLLGATVACAQEGPRHPVVGVAAPELRTDRITAGTDTLRVVLVSGGEMRDVGRMVLRTAVDADSIRRVERTTFGGVEAHRDSFVVSRRGLAPAWNREGGGAGSTVLAFRGAEVSGRVVAQGRGREVRARLPRPAFYANQVDLILRALPLAAGYAASVPLFDAESEELAWLHLRVAGEEPLALAGGGEARAWKVATELGGRAATYWVSVGPQTLLRHASRTPAGDTVLLLR